MVETYTPGIWTEAASGSPAVCSRPWAARSGGTDYTYCLGAENATGAYANGLAYSLDNEELLGHPATIEIAPGEELDHVYVTCVLPYEGGALDEGVEKVEAADGSVEVVGKNTAKTLSVPADLSSLAALADEIDRK